MEVQTTATQFLILTIIIVSTCIINDVNSATSAPTTTPPGCTYGGAHYSIGQHFKPSACKECHCTTSGPICAIGDCFYVPCIDSVHVPTRCCPICPNGENCKAEDGTVIKKGESYKPNSYTECRCPENNNLFFTGNRALCAHKQPPTTTPPPTFAPKAPAAHTG